MQREILSNGLSILFHKMPNTHSVTLGLYVRAGVGYQEEFVCGITHFLEHLHFRRMGDLTQEKLYYKMESLGSTLRAGTYRDFMKFTMKVIPENFQQCLDIFCELINANEWTDEEFAKEKQVVINQIIEKGNYVSTEKSARKIAFKKHPLSDEIMGSVDSVKSIQLINVQKYKEEIFNSKNLLFCITGNINDLQYEYAKEKLQTTIISSVGNKNVLEYPKCLHNRKPDIVLVPIEDDNLLDVNISFDIAYEDVPRDVMILLNCILGEGVGSRLQKHIREENGYTSNIASYVEWYEDFAILHIYFSVERKMLLSCFVEIMRVVRGMKNSLEKRDLDISLPFYTANQMFYEDDTEEMNFQLAYHTHVLEKDYVPIQLENNQATILFLQQCAKKLFVKNNLCVAVVGNTKRITKKSIVKAIDAL